METEPKTGGDQRETYRADLMLWKDRSNTWDEETSLGCHDQRPALHIHPNCHDDLQPFILLRQQMLPQSQLDLMKISLVHTQGSQVPETNQIMREAVLGRQRVLTHIAMGGDSRGSLRVRST